MRFLIPSVFASVIVFAQLVAAGCSDNNSGSGNTGGAAGAPASGGAAGPGAGGQGGSGLSGGGASFGGSPGVGGSITAAGQGGALASGGGSGGLKTGGAGGGSGGSSTGSGGASGGAGGGGGAMIPGPNYDTVKVVINETCFGNNCHNASENPMFLPQDSDMLYTKLTTHTTKHCGTLINKSNPAESALIKVLKGPCNGTARMPYQSCVDDSDSACIPTNFIDAMQQWIAAGAPK